MVKLSYPPHTEKSILQFRADIVTVELGVGLLTVCTDRLLCVAGLVGELHLVVGSHHLPHGLHMGRETDLNNEPHTITLTGGGN